jgi:hypothetical protein
VLAPHFFARRLNRQRYDKRGAHANAALDLYLAAVGFHDFFRNRQA